MKKGGVDGVPFCLLCTTHRALDKVQIDIEYLAWCHILRLYVS